MDTPGFRPINTLFGLSSSLALVSLAKREIKDFPDLGLVRSS